IFDGAREVPIVAPPIAGEKTQSGTQLVGPRDDVEGRTATARDERRVEPVGVEETERDGSPVAAERIERAPHDLGRGDRHPAKALGPGRDGPFGDDVAREADEQQRLGEDVVAATTPGAEALHDLVEGAET